MSPTSKTSLAKAAFAAGNLQACLGIVARWRPSRVVTPAQLRVMKTGYECLVHPEFYRSLGRDVDACVAEAKAVFASLFCKE